MATPNTVSAKGTDFSKITPWGLRPLTDYVAEELKRRSGEYGMNPSDSFDPSKAYAGPRTAWMRVCSNGVAPVSKPKGRVDVGVEDARNLDKQSTTMTEPMKSGFILGGVHGFADSFGFAMNVDTEKPNATVLGYTVNGEKHEIVNDQFSVFPNRPSPGITSIKTEFFSAGSGFPGLCRKAIVSWKCNSLDQLEYMFPYFLSPGVSVIVEWGWNNYNPVSLIDLTDEKEIIKMFQDSSFIYKRIEDSKGNYDCHIGKIFDYSFKMNSDGGFDCTTTIANSLSLIEGIHLQRSTTNKKDEFSHTVFSDWILGNTATTVENELTPEEEGVRTALAKSNNFTNTVAESRDSFKIEGDYWISMKSLVRFINYFFSVIVPRKGGGSGKIFRLDISEVKIMGHPLLKSVNREVLIPNKFAPSLEPSKAVISEISQSGAEEAKDFKPDTTPWAGKEFPNTENSGLFEEFKRTFGHFGLEFKYADIDAIINEKRYSRGNGGERRDYSFPQYSDKEGENQTTDKAGYYGFLEDIYVSTKLVKDTVAANDTLIGFIENLLGTISTAGSDIWEFRIIPNDVGSETAFGIQDNNYSGITEKSKVPVFTVGSAKDAHFIDFGMSVSMSEEMANQAILGQSKYIYREEKVDASETVTMNDPKVSIFTSDDRLFGKVIAGVEESESIESKIAHVLSRDSTEGLIYKEHRLVEHDDKLMKKLVYSGVVAKHLAAPLMPGTEATLECLGIGGIRFLDMIALDKVPNPYAYQRAVWQIEGVNNTIENNVWKTLITARVRPLVIISKLPE